MFVKIPMVSQLGMINHAKVNLDKLLLGVYSVKVLYNFEIALNFVIISYYSYGQKCYIFLNTAVYSIELLRMFAFDKM